MLDSRSSDMKKTLIIACAISFLFCWNTTAMAVPKPKPLDRDCTAAKAGKNTALKATVGVGGPCGPADAAKDTVGLDDKKAKKKEKG